MLLVCFVTVLKQTYGSIYALSDMATCLGLALGPLVGPPLAHALGYEMAFVIFGGFSLLYLPVLLYLRSLPRIHAPEHESKRAPLLPHEEEYESEEDDTRDVVVHNLSGYLK